MNTTTLRSSFLGALLVAVTGLTALGQSTIGQSQEYRPITTAVPILTVAPDARAAGMGDAGVATSPDVNAVHWNPAKLGFLEEEFGASLSYTPWLGKITNDMYLAYLSGFKKLTPNSSIAASLLYFDLGDLNFTDANGTPTGYFNPKEYAFTVSYGQRLSDNLSLGIGARYIRSNLAGNTNVSTPTGYVESRPGNSAAVDLGIYYNKDIAIGSKNYNLALGGNISNVGAKISYTSADRKDFLPTNLRLGTAFTVELDPYNKLTLAVDANKLLVPSTDSANQSTVNQPNVFSGIFQSFSDAPNGFSEELKEFTIATGVEYWYDNMFAARVGYFYENELKGGRKYLTMGLGLRYQKFGLDAAYLVPNEQNNPLAQTIRFSLHFKFAGND